MVTFPRHFHLSYHQLNTWFSSNPYFLHTFNHSGLCYFLTAFVPSLSLPSPSFSSTPHLSPFDLLVSRLFPHPHLHTTSSPKAATLLLPLQTLLTSQPYTLWSSQNPTTRCGRAQTWDCSASRSPTTANSRWTRPTQWRAQSNPLPGDPPSRHPGVRNPAPSCTAAPPMEHSRSNPAAPQSSSSTRAKNPSVCWRWVRGGVFTSTMAPCGGSSGCRCGSTVREDWWMDPRPP